MKTFPSLFARLLAILAIVFAGNTASTALAATPPAKAAATVIHLDQYNGYFAARETLADLKPGAYEIVVTNKSGKLAGFQVQAMGSKETLDMFPLEPGAVKTSRIQVGADGFRFRCPINPTPWYEIDSIKQ